MKDSNKIFFCAVLALSLAACNSNQIAAPQAKPNAQTDSQNKNQNADRGVTIIQGGKSPAASPAAPGASPGSKPSPAAGNSNTTVSVAPNADQSANVITIAGDDAMALFGAMKIKSVVTKANTCSEDKKGMQIDCSFSTDQCSSIDAAKKVSTNYSCMMAMQPTNGVISVLASKQTPDSNVADLAQDYIGSVISLKKADQSGVITIAGEPSGSKIYSGIIFSTSSSKDASDAGKHGHDIESIAKKDAASNSVIYTNIINIKYTDGSVVPNAKSSLAKIPNAGATQSIDDLLNQEE